MSQRQHKASEALHLIIPKEDFETTQGIPPPPCVHGGVTFLLANAWGFVAELIESAMYLYRATRDPTLLELGRDAVESIEKISKVDCGFATVGTK